MDTDKLPAIVQFFVLPDDGVEPLLRPLHAARSSIDIYIYKLTNQEIIDALSDAVKRGVRVRAIADRAPSGDETSGQAVYTTLEAMGASVCWAPPYFVKSHAKCFVVDDSLALISSFNFIADWHNVRDHGATTSDPAIVRGLAATFQADWEDHPLGTRPPSALVLSPDTSRAAVLDLLDTAREAILIEHQQIADDEIIDKLASLSYRGVEVRIITRASEDKNRPYLDRLQQLAPDVHVFYHNLLDIHTKLIVVDRRTMVLGSLNLTDESLDRRREISLLLSDQPAISRALAVAEQDMRASG